MQESSKGGTRRSQKDYTLCFKLSVVSLVEKVDMTYKQAKTFMASKVDRLFCFG